jgi:hypothetical protein
MTTTPERIEAEIAARRASLEEKLHELERRMSPKEQFRRLRAKANPDPYMGLAAMAAVATGACLAVTGWRRCHRADNSARYDYADMMGE